jgi:hypothetical protein
MLTDELEHESVFCGVFLALRRADEDLRFSREILKGKR